MSGLFKKRLDDSAESRMEHPASKSWIFFTFLLAFVLCIVFGEIFWAPDFVALTLIFWTLREPDRVGFLTAFICGILMDALFGTVLGERHRCTALGYLDEAPYAPRTAVRLTLTS